MDADADAKNSAVAEAENTQLEALALLELWQWLRQRGLPPPTESDPGRVHRVPALKTAIKRLQRG